MGCGGDLSGSRGRIGFIRLFLFAGVSIHRRPFSLKGERDRRSEEILVLSVLYNRFRGADQSRWSGPVDPFLSPRVIGVIVEVVSGSRKNAAENLKDVGIALVRHRRDLRRASDFSQEIIKVLPRELLADLIQTSR